MFLADTGCPVLHPEIPDVEDYIDDITYPSATLRLDSTEISAVDLSQQSESESESESESDESSTIKIEPTSDDEDDTLHEDTSNGTCASYDDGPKDPDKNQKERERNLRKGESLRLLRQKILESGIDYETVGDEKKMTEEVTLKLTIQLIQHLKLLIHQRGGNLANCKHAAPLANRKFHDAHCRALGSSGAPRKKPQNRYLRFTQVRMHTAR